MKICGFDLAKMLNLDKCQFNIQPGMTYIIDTGKEYEEATLDRITVAPSFELKKTWYGKQYYKPTYKTLVCLSIVYPPGDFVVSKTWTEDLSQFVENLQSYRYFKADLSEAWKKLNEK